MGNIKNAILIGLPLALIIGIILFLSQGKSDSNQLSRQSPFPSENTTRTQSNNQSNQTAQADNYIPYSSEALAEARTSGRTLIFFHANWCPTCRVAEKDILQNNDQLPKDLTILKTDYDTERELKKRYNVSVQHTYVQVDSDGNEVTKWIGGGVREINEFIEEI